MGRFPFSLLLQRSAIGKEKRDKEIDIIIAEVYNISIQNICFRTSDFLKMKMKTILPAWLWAEEGIKEELRHCFAHYEKSDIEAALVSTRTLFAGLARETAKRKGYKYPLEAEKYAKNFV